jgi:hypothetical protein
MWPTFAAGLTDQGEISPTAALMLVAIVGLVVTALTARTRNLARRRENPRIRRAGEKGRREFQREAARVIDRYLAELPPEPPRTRLSMDVRDRVDLSDRPAQDPDDATVETSGPGDMTPADVHDER